MPLNILNQEADDRNGSVASFSPRARHVRLCSETRREAAVADRARQASAWCQKPKGPDRLVASPHRRGTAINLLAMTLYSFAAFSIASSASAASTVPNGLALAAAL